MTLKERMETGAAHDPRSIALYKALAELDFDEGGDRFCFKSGGDGDNGDHLMYLLDVWIEKRDVDMRESFARLEAFMKGAGHLR